MDDAVARRTSARTVDIHRKTGYDLAELISQIRKMGYKLKQNCLMATSGETLVAGMLMDVIPLDDDPGEKARI